MKDVNIAIVNWKMRDDIYLCLDSLYKDISGDDLDVAVYVVDNSANVDKIKEMLEEKYPEVNYINPGENLGFGKAQNLALSKEKAKFYLPLNPDVQFKEKGSFKALINYLDKNEKVGIVAPKLLNTDGTVQYSCFRFSGFFDQIVRRLNFDKKFKFFKKRVDYYLMKDFDHEKVVPVDWIMGSFMLIKKEVVDEIGFFDDRYFMYFEDCDLCRRAWRKGWEVHYSPEVVVYHGHRRESDDGSPLKSIFKNPVVRMHIKSWLKYFWKWGLKKEHYGA